MVNEKAFPYRNSSWPSATGFYSAWKKKILVPIIFILCKRYNSPGAGQQCNSKPAGQGSARLHENVTHSQGKQRSDYWPCHFTKNTLLIFWGVQLFVWEGGGRAVGFFGRVVFVCVCFVCLQSPAAIARTVYLEQRMQQKSHLVKG